MTSASDNQRGTRGQSVTASEAYLAGLGRKAFLHMWSYPNLYRDQGKARTGEGKELCDLLVVFGNDVLIFSDKHCALRSGPDLRIAWRRWYRDAVLASAKQVAGAERWLLEQHSRVFLDRACTQALPVELPKQPRIHRIVTCRGAAGASRELWGGSGSLLVTNAALAACSEQPLHLGCFDDRGRMFHVLDEIVLEHLLLTLDTVSDLCMYLTRKEAFFRRHEGVIATGEEALLGFYLSSLSPDESGHDFIVDGNPSSVTIDDSFWKWWEESAQRKGKEAADDVSYCWDRLIEKFAHHMLHGTQYFPSRGGVREDERLVRWMAREDRVRRRMLADALISAMQTTREGQLRRRCVFPGTAGDPFWVFLVIPRPAGVPYEQYRRDRQSLLVAHCEVIKYLKPEANDILGIAVDPRPDEMTEDVVYIDVRDWTPEMNENARVLHERSGIFRAPTRQEARYWECPLPGEKPSATEERGADPGPEGRKQ